MGGLQIQRRVPRLMIAGRFWGSLLGFCLAAGIGYSEEPAPKPVPPTPRYDARLRADYEYRSQGDARDSDLYGYWYGGGRDLVNGCVDFYTSGRLHGDLDGSSSTDGTYSGLDDAHDVSENRVMQLYMDGHNREASMRLRAGRQYIDTADYLHLDGAHATFGENAKIGAAVYFGRAVSYYSTVSDDRAYGLSLLGRPWEGNRMRFTYAQYLDDIGGDDHNYFFDFQQEITAAARARAQTSVLNGDFRMGRLDFYYYALSGETDFVMGGSYWGRFDAETRAYSPLYSILGEQEPYTFGYARLTQQILTGVLLSPGISARMAEDEDENFSNRSYTDYDLTLTYEPSRAVSSSVSLDYWDEDNGDSSLGLSGEIRYRHAKVWEVGLGAAYADYTYNSYSDISYSINGGQTIFTESGTVIEETPYSYTYFLRTKWNINRNLVLRLQCDVEDDSTSSDLAFRGRGSIEVRL